MPTGSAGLDRVEPRRLQRRLRNLVVGRGLTLAVAGVAIGAFGAWLLTGLLKTMCSQISAATQPDHPPFKPFQMSSTT